MEGGARPARPRGGSMRAQGAALAAAVAAGLALPGSLPALAADPTPTPTAGGRTGSSSSSVTISGTVGPAAGDGAGSVNPVAGDPNAAPAAPATAAPTPPASSGRPGSPASAARLALAGRGHPRGVAAGQGGATLAGGGGGTRPEGTMQLQYVELPTPASASDVLLNASGPLLVGFGALLPGEILLLVLGPRRRRRVLVAC
jgi:hypothetical protein